MSLIVKRDLPAEAWRGAIAAGTVVYKYHGPTYGCVSGEGIAVTEEDGKEPFFEIPADSVKEARHAR